jgi:hypothetical protein
MLSAAEDSRGQDNRMTPCAQPFLGALYLHLNNMIELNFKNDNS